MITQRAENKPKFAFTWEGTQCTFNWLLQRHKCSPSTAAHDALAELLHPVEMPSGVHMHQNTDDILVGGSNKEQVGQVAETIWNLLTCNALNIPPSKCQGPGQEIKFLGAWWMAETVVVPNDALSAIEKGQTPDSRTELQ